MKPRAFIGSSVEGLNVAYAVQQNLLYDAEITVWSQGVFQLSSAAVESLLEVLSTSDFGIFVLTPDDIAIIRKHTSLAIRDNVLFELGLFMGKLGRERAFFLVPDNEPDLHIPTDLLGITPAKYEGKRSDSNMKAATGPACHDIRIQIRKVGILASRVEIPSAPEEAGNKESKTESNWFDHFSCGRYQEAKQLLEVKRLSESGPPRLITEGWICFCGLKLSEVGALNAILDLCRANATSDELLGFVALILRQEQYVEKALEVLSLADTTVKDGLVVRLAIADTYLTKAEPALALAALDGPVVALLPEISIKRSEILESTGSSDEAMQVIYASYCLHPTNEAVRFRFARIADQMRKYEIAAFFLQKLARDYPKNSSYWGYLGNACFGLGLFDQALAAYRIGATCSDRSVQWIHANIGNLFTTKDLSTDACLYLDQVVKVEPSQYAYERLASAIKKKETEAKLLEQKCLEGMRQVNALKTPDTNV